LRVPTSRGDVQLKVPPRPSPGACFGCVTGRETRCAGRAAATVLRVVIETPVHLSAEQRELIGRLEESLKAPRRQAPPRETGFLRGDAS